MKKSFISLLALSLVLVSCSSPVQIETPTSPAKQTPTPTLPASPTPQTDPLHTPWEDRSIYRSGLVAAAQPVLDELRGASVYHIEFSIAGDLSHVTGFEQVQYTNTETVNLNEIEFRLFPNILGGKMEVANLTAGGKTITPNYGFNNSLLIVPLPSPLIPGQSIVIGMDFFVTVPQSVDLNYGVLAYYQDVLALAHAYPMVAVYDDEGWNAEIPPQAGDVTYADASFFLVEIAAPKDLTLVTTGKEIQRHSAGETQFIYVASGPARDFYLAASPLYAETDGTLGETTIRSFAPKDLTKGSQQAVDTASRAIQVYSKRYEAYPYTELDIVSTPTQALGIEYPGMIAIASRIYDVDHDINGTPLRVYMESTVAHEAAHQWFYNLVGNDQLDDPWLDESLAQFATLQYYEDQYGPQGAAGFKQSLEARWARVNNENIPIGLPVASYSGQEYSAIVYGRGPLFFVALRDRMGTDAFDSFLKDYTEQLAWKISTPAFLQSLAEKHCACDLDPLFKEWVYPP